MNKEVDAIIKKAESWKEEFKKLRAIVLESGLEEEVKWGQPCYSLNGKNVLIIHGFKEYCAILFVKGALLKDPKGILVQQTENVQSARQIRFSSVKDIEKMEKAIKAYVKEAIENEKSGLKVELKKTSDYEVPDEFKIRLDKDRALKTAFESLTPGRQRAYLYYFSQAKQSATREARVEKCAPKILEGLGLDD
jgi:uncharacterized protein YdeI (YjbR/CyaY-like superfamily)